MIKGGALFPRIAKLGQKYYFNNKALQFVGNLLGKYFIPIPKDWSKIREKYFIPICEDWDKPKREIIYANSKRLE